MQLSDENIGAELKRWFDVSIIRHNDIHFDDRAVFRLVLDLFRSDHARYYPGEPVALNHVQFRAELQGILLYRIARHYFLAGNPVCDQYASLGRFLSGFELYYSSDIGEGFKINHGMGTVVGARCVIGKNATLHHGITLGDKNGGRPRLGDFVTVYPGAVIIGDIVIGDHVTVAANAVCMNDVPAHNMAVGIPARNLKT